MQTLVVAGFPAQERSGVDCFRVFSFCTVIMTAGTTSATIMPLSLPMLLTPVILALRRETELCNNSSLTPIVYGLGSLFLELQRLFLATATQIDPSKSQSPYCVFG